MWRKLLVFLLLFIVPPKSDSASRNLVLVELFTSEGCSSCPPADRILDQLDRNQPVASAEIIVISEHVDYWDHLGWVDPFSSPQFTARQRTYANRFHLESVYTPQAVIDGHSEIVGNDLKVILEAITACGRESKSNLAVSASRSGTSGIINVSLPKPVPGTELFLVVTRDHAQHSVSRGENNGKFLSHVSVAYIFEALSESKPRARVDLQGTGPSRVIAFLQIKNTGRVIAVGQTRI